MAESEVKTEILKKYPIEFPGGRLVRVYCGSVVSRHGARITGAEPGTSDLCGWLPDGRFLAVEVKTPGGKTAKARAEKQTAFRDAVNMAGGCGVQVETWEELRAAVKQAMSLPFE